MLDIDNLLIEKCVQNTNILCYSIQCKLYYYVQVTCVLNTKEVKYVLKENEMAEPKMVAALINTDQTKFADLQFTSLAFESTSLELFIDISMLFCCVVLNSQSALTSQKIAFPFSAKNNLIRKKDSK